VATEPRLVRIVIDPEVPAGAFRVGGVRIVRADDDAALGRELRTREVGVRSEAEAASRRALVAETDWLEMADQPND
jgi:hypothetical protein